MKIIEVFGLSEFLFDELWRFVSMDCCASDAWRLQVFQVSAADLLSSGCHESIFFFKFRILSFLQLVMLYCSCLWMVSLDDIIFVLIRSGVFGVLFFHLGFVHLENFVTREFS